MSFEQWCFAVIIGCGFMLWAYLMGRINQAEHHPWTEQTQREYQEHLENSDFMSKTKDTGADNVRAE